MVMKIKKSKIKKLTAVFLFYRFDISGDWILEKDQIPAYIIYK